MTQSIQNPKPLVLQDDTDQNTGSVAQKLMLIVLFVLTPVLLLLIVLYLQQTIALERTSTARQGVKQLTLTSRLLKSFSDEARIAIFQKSKLSVRAGLSEEAKQSSRINFSSLQDVVTAHNDPFALSDPIEGLKLAMQDLQVNQEMAASGAGYADSSYKLSVEFLDLATLGRDEIVGLNQNIGGARLQPMLESIALESKLSTDSDPLVSILSTLLTRQIPKVLLLLDDMGFESIEALTEKTTGHLGHPDLRTDSVLLGNQIIDIRNSIDLIAKTNPAYADALETFYSSLRNHADDLTQRIKFEVTETSKISAPVKPLALTYQKTNESLGLLNNMGLQQLEKILTERYRNLLNTQLLFMALAVGLLAYIIWSVARFIQSITRPIKSMVGVLQNVGRGNLDELVPVTSNDELGTLAKSFNSSILGLRDLVQTREQRDDEKRKREELQGNIAEFLDTAVGIADGDLTRKGRVTDDILGNVVDAVNLMTEELSVVLGDVHQAANMVASSASEVDKLSVTVASGASQNANSASDAQTKTELVAQNIQRMAQDASSTAQAAMQTLSASQEGQVALENTLLGMQGVRQEVGSISKAIKSLSERSLEISDVVSTISNIASQTNLLALNAAIEAASAGEAGGRFAIVADEVRKLADDAARATHRVDGLIKNIQSEVQSVVVSVEKGTNEVEQGYRIASQAGDRLKQISSLANQSASLASAIANVAQDQVGSVIEVNSSVQSIARTALQNQTQSEQNRQTAEQLRTLSEQLRRSLSRFRLSEQPA